MKTKERSLLNRIERNPQIMMGKPVIKGTRLPIDILLEKLAYGHTEQTLLEEYPFFKLKTSNQFYYMQVKLFL